MGIFIPRSGKQAQAKREHKVRAAEIAQQKKEAKESLERQVAFWSREENRTAQRRASAAQAAEALEARRARINKLEWLDIWYLQVVTGKFACFACKTTYQHRNIFLCRMPYKGKEIYFCEECLMVDLLGSSLSEEEAQHVLQPHAKWLNGM